MLIQDAIDKCVLDVYSTLAGPTGDTYRKGLARFVEFLESKNLKTNQPLPYLTIEHFIEFPGWLLREKYKRQTAIVYISASKALLDWLVIAGYFKLSYQDTLRYEKAREKLHRNQEERLPRWPHKDEVDKMLDAVHNYNEASPQKERNISILEFLASSGCRVSEALSLDVKDIDLEKRTTVVIGKRNKERRVFFSQGAAVALAEYWRVRKARGANDPAFSRHDKAAGKKILRLKSATVRRVVDQVAMIAGIDPSKFSPHYFRHAFAIRMLRETGNMALVQDLLGHSDPKSTRVYAKIYEEDLQKEYKKVYG